MSKRNETLNKLINKDEPFQVSYIDNGDWPDDRLRRYADKIENFTFLNEDFYFEEYVNFERKVWDELSLERKIEYDLYDSYIRIYSDFDCTGQWFTQNCKVHMFGKYVIIDFIDSIDC